MKKFLMYTTVLLFTAITTFACSKDKDEDKATSATIQLVDLLGKPVKGVRVHAYDQDTRNMMGDETFHATFQVISDDAGNATFSNLDKGTQFTSVNNETNTFTFSAHYTLNNSSKTKRVSITLKKGDNKTEKLVLN